MNENKEAGAPQNQGVKKAAKRQSKHKTVVLTEGLASVAIRWEKPRGNRKPWRIEWFENGKDCAEMFETQDEAYTHAEAKLHQLSDGQRTLTREELEHLFSFKLQVEQFNKRLASSGRTLEQVVSDTIAAAEILPGWTTSQMAQFISEHHGVKNPMLVKDAIAKFIAHLESGYKRDYSRKYKVDSKRALDKFGKQFGDRRSDSIVPKEFLDFIVGLRVKPTKRGDPSKPGKDGLVPASGKTRRLVFIALNRCFDFAKKVLEALPAKLPTAMEMLESPEYVTPDPEIYTFGEVKTAYSLLEDLESTLFVSLQLYAGLRPCECKRMHKKDIRRDASGKLSFIFVRQEVGKRSPTTGRRRIRTRKAPITPPLATLLDSLELSNGLIFHSRCVEARIHKLFGRAKFTPKYDAFRHSFISYRLADIKDRPQVAYEAGHGVDVQIEHYEGLIEDMEDVAKYWDFAIPTTGLPWTLNFRLVGREFVHAYKQAKTSSQNVVPIPHAA